MGAIFAGVVGNRSDAAVTLVFQQVRERFRKGGKPVNHDLQRAFRRSSLKACLMVCKEYEREAARSKEEGSWAEKLRGKLN